MVQLPARVLISPSCFGCARKLTRPQSVMEGINLALKVEQLKVLPVVLNLSAAMYYTGISRCHPETFFGKRAKNSQGNSESG